MVFRRTLFTLAGLFLLASCKNEKTEEITKIDTITPATTGSKKFTSAGHHNKALVLTENLMLYNMDRSENGKATGLYGLIVDIDSVSQKRFALGKTDDQCLEHNFIYVNHSKVKGWCYGEDVFEYLHDSRDTTFTSNGIDFKLYATKNFAIGVSDDDGLTFCGDKNPVVLYNSKYKTEAFIPMVPNKNYNDSRYLVLDSFDGWYDKIKDVKLSDNTLTLAISREYQEGSADFIIEIQLSEDGYSGKVVNTVMHEPL